MDTLSLIVVIIASLYISRILAFYIMNSKTIFANTARLRGIDFERLGNIKRALFGNIKDNRTSDSLGIAVALDYLHRDILTGKADKKLIEFLEQKNSNNLGND